MVDEGIENDRSSFMRFRDPENASLAWNLRSVGLFVIELTNRAGTRIDNRREVITDILLHGIASRGDTRYKQVPVLATQSSWQIEVIQNK